MKKYVIRRIFSGILTILVVFSLNFVLVRSAPGDPIRSLMGKETDDPELRAALEAKWGFDKPVIEQYASYLGNALKGDLGTSIIYNRSVNEMIGERVGATVVLGIAALLVSFLVGTAMGIFCARRDGSLIDTTLSTLSYATDAMPSFWLGLMLMIILATKLKLLPSQGMINVRAGYTGFRYYLDVAQHMILPGLTLVLITMSGYFRITKSSILQVTSEDFITTMRATGMSEKKIFNKYIFRNAILPTVTMLGISVAFLITGVSLIEIVFSWPGMGRLTLTAITQRDYPTLMGVYLVMNVSVVIVMIITDILYGILDPRIRYD